MFCNYSLYRLLFGFLFGLLFGGFFFYEGLTQTSCYGFGMVCCWVFFRGRWLTQTSLEGFG